MKITRLTFAKCRLPFRKPFATARGTLHERETFIIALHDGEGRIGIGEAAPLPAFGGENLDDAEMMLSALAQRASFPECSPRVEGIASWREEIGITVTENPVTSFGIECALLSVVAQARNVYPAELFGVADVRDIKTYGLIGGEDAEELAADAERAAAQGFTTLKIKVGFRNVDEDIALLQRLHRRLPDLTWRADANGTWSETEAMRFLIETVSSRLDYVEDPVEGRQLPQLNFFPADLHAKIAFDEPANAAARPGEFVESYSPAVVILKPALLGSFSRLQEWVGAVRGKETRVIVTSFLESSVGLFYDALCTLALDTREEAHGLATASLLKSDTVTHPFCPTSGRLAIRDPRDFADMLTDDLKTTLKIA